MAPDWVNPYIEHHSGLRVSETFPAWDTACNYQAYVEARFPNGTTGLGQYSTRRNGCNFGAAWFDYANWNGTYPNRTGIYAKWDSDAAIGGDWTTIGTLYRW